MKRTNFSDFSVPGICVADHGRGIVREDTGIGCKAPTHRLTMRKTRE